MDNARWGTEPEDPNNGLLGGMPPEILHLVLNGRASVSLWHGKSPAPWKRSPGPYLDPRWRFVTRMVCRLWCFIVEHPTAGEARSMGRCRRKWCGSTEADAARVDCPKWPTGRMVCASVVVDWIAWRPDLWNASTFDALYGWCRHCAPLTRKHLIATLVATLQHDAARHALDVEWKRVVFTRVNVAEEMAHAFNGYHWRHDDTWWHNDETGNAFVMRQVLVDVISERIPSMLSLPGVCDVRLVYALPESWIKAACVGGNGTFLESLLNLPGQKARAHALNWTRAAAAADPSAFAALVRLGKQNHPLVDALPAITVETRGAFHDFRNGWMADAIHNGNWSVLDVCDHEGTTFDASVAMACAASWRRLGVMQWLWARAERRRECARLDLRHAVVAAVSVCARRPRRPTKAIEWVCVVAQYRPPSTEGRDILEAIIGSNVVSDVPALVHLMGQWPRATLSLDPSLWERAFCICAWHSLESLRLFLEIFEGHHGHALGIVPTKGFDGWHALCSLHSINGYGAWRDPTVDTEDMLALLRIAHCGVLGTAPLTTDVNRFRLDRRGANRRRCACLSSPVWSHDGPRESLDAPPLPLAETDGANDTDSGNRDHVGGHDSIAPPTADPPSMVDGEKEDGTEGHPVRPTVDGSSIAISTAAVSEGAPPTVVRTARLLGRWCVPRPVRLDALLPGWKRPTNRGFVSRNDPIHPLFAVRRARDQIRMRLVDWLETHDLILHDP